MLTIYVKEGDTLRPKKVKRVEIRMFQQRGETAEMPVPLLFFDDGSEISPIVGKLYYEGQFIGEFGNTKHEQGAMSVVDIAKRLIRDL